MSDSTAEQKKIWCTTCGKPLAPGRDSNGEFCKCHSQPDIKLIGWKCPVCGVGVSPFMSYCPQCANGKLPRITF